MLAKYLVDQRLVTGPLVDGNTSHSNMGVMKNFLTGQQQFSGDESFLKFGNVLHKYLQFIEDINFHCEEFDELTPEEQKWLYGCVNSARQNPIVKRLLMKTVREQKVYTEIDGMKIALILDVEQQHTQTGIDWKSTSCRNLADFVSKAITYDYIRQSILYKHARKLKHFYFIGLQKRPPHQVYIMDVSRFEADVLYAQQELKFLLYVYKHYGKVILNKNTQSVINMADASKEYLKSVQASHKELKAKIAAHKKLIKNFPAKDKKLYADKLNKLALKI